MTKSKPAPAIKATSAAAAVAKPTSAEDIGHESADDAVGASPFLPADVQNGTSRYDPVGNLEPSPGFTAVPTEDLRIDLDYTEPRTALNPAMVLADDADAASSSDAVRVSDLPRSFPLPHNSDGGTDPELPTDDDA